MLNLINIPLYAIADRWTGGGAKTLDAKIPGRLGLWVAALAGVFDALVFTPWAALTAVGYALMRSTGFHTFGGSLDPTTPKELLGSFLRFFLPTVIAAEIATIEMHGDLLKTLGAMGGAALISTAASFWYGLWIKKLKDTNQQPTWDPNVYVELIHGAAYGAAVACILS